MEADILGCHLKDVLSYPLVVSRSELENHLLHKNGKSSFMS